MGKGSLSALQFEFQFLSLKVGVRFPVLVSHSRKSELSAYQLSVRRMAMK